MITLITLRSGPPAFGSGGNMQVSLLRENVSSNVTK
jgi:hypothetical protein